jgi:hypothetical protein
MTTPGTLADGSRTGYGFGLAIGELSGHPRIGHGGGINGFLSQLDNYPADTLTIAVLANSESAHPDRLAEDIARLVLGIARPVVRDLPVGSGEIARFAGTYTLGPLQIRVFESSGKLMAQATGQPPFGLRWQGDSSFVAAFDDNVKVVFGASMPRATSFVLFQGGLAQTATRVK